MGPVTASHPVTTEKNDLDGNVLAHLRHIESEVADVRERVVAIERKQVPGRLWDLFIKVGSGLAFAAAAMMVAHEVQLARHEDKLAQLPPRYLTNAVENNARMIEAIDLRLRAIETSLSANQVMLQALLDRVREK